MRKLFRPIELLVVYLTVRAAPRRRILGFLVSCSSVDADCELFFRQCTAALDLIRKFDPRRFDRIRRNVRAIALTTRGSSYYEHRLGTVFIDVDELKREPDRLAATLVHEATHARLYWAGIRDYLREAGRHERLCVAEQIRFASRLPHSDRLVQELKHMLEDPWWNEAGRRARIRRFVDRHNLPHWLERFMVRFGAR